METNFIKDGLDVDTKNNGRFLTSATILEIVRYEKKVELQPRR